MRHFLVVADYNDADYVSGVVAITDEEFEKFLPLMEAINDYQPYIYKHGVCYNNWDANRPDLYEKTAEQKYPQFSPELIDEFREKFLSMHNPAEDYGCSGFHSIISIQEVTLGNVYVKGAYSDVRDRQKEMVEEYYRRERELYGRGTPRDLYSMQPKYMTKEEKERCDKAWNLWLDYRPDLDRTEAEEHFDRY